MKEDAAWWIMMGWILSIMFLLWQQPTKGNEDQEDEDYEDDDADG